MGGSLMATTSNLYRSKNYESALGSSLRPRLRNRDRPRWRGVLQSVKEVPQDTRPVRYVRDRKREKGFAAFQQRQDKRRQKAGIAPLPQNRREESGQQPPPLSAAFQQQHRSALPFVDSSRRAGGSRARGVQSLRAELGRKYCARVLRKQSHAGRRTPACRNCKRISMNI